MATWESPLPKNGEPIEVGDPDHDVIHTQTVDCIEELRAVVDDVEASIPTVPAAPTADTLSGATAVGKSVMKAADAAAARTAIGAGTGSSNLVLGTTSTTAKAGDYVPTYAEVTGKPTTFAPTIGTTASTAAAGNHTHTGLLTGSASALADSDAADVEGLVNDLNALLAVLRSRGVLSA